MTDTSTATIDTVVDDYFAMFNETDADRRAAIIARAWTDDASYLDPLLAAEGPSALAALVDGVHQQYPGYRFRLVGGIDTHHDRARWDWDLVAPDGSTYVTGVDYAVLADDGRLRAVTGFFAAPTA